MRFVYTLFGGAIFLLLFSCKKNLELGSRSSVSLNYCIQNKSDHIKVCLDSLLEDSRCPREVYCIWQGTAIVKFSVTVNDQQQPITLSTLTRPGLPPTDTILMGYKIEFLDLLPYPEANSTHYISEYRAELRITKQ
jgi:hypothetical protein